MTVNTTVGGYAQQRFGWRDRVFLTGAVRVDNNSAFGDDFTWVAYPKLSATWVISEEPFWTRVADVVDGVKLRAAYGQSGNIPRHSPPLRTVTNSPARERIRGHPRIAGQSNLQPERGEEYEVGFEDGLFGEWLDVTHQPTDRTRFARGVAPSSGFAGTQTVNIGETSNRGFELMANLQALTRENFAWEIGGNISTNRDRVEDRGGLPPGTGTFRDAEGYPIGGFWTKSIASADRDPTTHAIPRPLTQRSTENGPPGLARRSGVSWHADDQGARALTNTFTMQW